MGKENKLDIENLSQKDIDSLKEKLEYRSSRARGREGCCTQTESAILV
jgi:hypothetical protein